MMKQLILVSILLILVPLVHSLEECDSPLEPSDIPCNLISTYDFDVEKTEITRFGYEVTIKGYDEIPVFDLDNVTVFNIRQKLSDKLDVVDAVNAYNKRIAGGKEGCNTTQQCWEWGWLNDTICEYNLCVDTPTEPYNLTKKQQLDDVLFRQRELGGLN